MNITIDLTDSADDKDREAIVRPLIAYNVQKTGVEDFRPLAVLVRDENQAVIGGLWGRTSFGWLYVELLFVPESLRGRGIGTELMRRAETEAIARGCHDVWLDTLEFQARGFYERLGYTCFGELANYPTGFARYFMTRKLEAAPPDTASPAT